VIEFEGLLSTQSLHMSNVCLRRVRSIHFWWTLKRLGWHKGRFPSLSRELPPHIQQAAGHVMIAADLGRDCAHPSPVTGPPADVCSPPRGTDSTCPSGCALRNQAQTREHERNVDQPQRVPLLKQRQPALANCLANRRALQKVAQAGLRELTG